MCGGCGGWSWIFVPFLSMKRGECLRKKLEAKHNDDTHYLGTVFSGCVFDTKFAPGMQAACDGVQVAA